MKTGDHVKVIGIDGFYIFLKEFQGTATLSVGSAATLKEPNTLSIPMDRVISLEKAD
ncbi:MAG TPA: hypothetical protein VI386_25485 [Candidatus Sulfotelmatobacter sp.]